MAGIFSDEQNIPIATYEGIDMTSARAIEYRITRELTSGVIPSSVHGPERVVRRLIAVSAGAGGLLALGSYAPELVGVALAASVVWALGTR